MQTEAVWQTDGVFAQARNTTAPETWEVSQNEPEGLVFANATLDNDWGPANYELVNVEWLAGTPFAGRGGDLEFTLTSEAEVTALVREDISQERTEEGFREFVENLTSADEETVDAWTEDFLASRTAEDSARPSSQGNPVTFYRYRRGIGDLAVSNLYERVQPEPPRTAPQAHPDLALVQIGTAHTGTDDWAFEFEFPTVTLENGSVGKRGVERVQVDALDRISVRVGFHDPGLALKETSGLVDGAFQTLGWPSPSIDEDDVHLGAIC